MKVSFMIIGAMKCGTTTLSAILSRHPDVCFSNPKEPHFFSKTPDWRSHIKAYEALFEKKATLYGEGSTTYTCYPEFNKEIWQDIHAYNPDMKLIYLIRNPVDRVVSHYIHLYTRGYTSKNLTDAVKKIPSLISRGKYYSQIHPYLTTFGKENVLIATFDDLIEERESLLNQIAAFLKIDFSKFSDYHHIHENASLGKVKMNHQIDRLLNTRVVKCARHIIPHTMRDRTRNFISKRFTRSLQKKPDCPTDTKYLIINKLHDEIIKMEDLCNCKLSQWLEIQRL